MGLCHVWMLLSQTACVRESLLRQFLHEADVWKWGRSDPDVLGSTARDKLLLICQLAFSVVYRGDLRNIAMDWLHEMRVPYRGRWGAFMARPRLIATRRSFPDYRTVLQGPDFVSRVMQLEDSSSEYLCTSASESDTDDFLLDELAALD